MPTLALCARFGSEAVVPRMERNGRSDSLLFPSLSEPEGGSWKQSSRNTNKAPAQRSAQPSLMHKCHPVNAGLAPVAHACFTPGAAPVKRGRSPGLYVTAQTSSFNLHHTDRPSLLLGHGGSGFCVGFPALLCLANAFSPLCIFMTPLLTCCSPGFAFALQVG